MSHALAAYLEQAIYAVATSNKHAALMKRLGLLPVVGIHLMASNVARRHNLSHEQLGEVMSTLSSMACRAVPVDPQSPTQEQPATGAHMR